MKCLFKLTFSFWGSWRIKGPPSFWKTAAFLERMNKRAVFQSITFNAILKCLIAQFRALWTGYFPLAKSERKQVACFGYNGAYASQWPALFMFIFWRRLNLWQPVFYLNSEEVLTIDTRKFMKFTPKNRLEKNKPKLRKINLLLFLLIISFIL